MTTTLLPTHLDSDAALVDRSRRNDLRAFEQIVARYQTLVCSVALAAVGDVSRSEDLAQEVFLTAWQRIRELREPAKLARTDLFKWEIAELFRPHAAGPFERLQG